ncbi:MAG TPA: hypothetical protein DIT09_12285 [Glutamicibacter sp.]|nr:hypothetical protein [Glutamicibacter sp.]
MPSTSNNVPLHNIFKTCSCGSLGQLGIAQGFGCLHCSVFATAQLPGFIYGVLPAEIDGGGTGRDDRLHG